MIPCRLREFPLDSSSSSSYSSLLPKKTQNNVMYQKRKGKEGKKGKKGKERKGVVEASHVTEGLASVFNDTCLHKSLTVQDNVTHIVIIKCTG